jgi:hypothetical protein
VGSAANEREHGDESDRSLVAFQEHHSDFLLG